MNVLKKFENYAKESKSDVVKDIIKRYKIIKKLFRDDNIRYIMLEHICWEFMPNLAVEHYKKYRGLSDFNFKILQSQPAYDLIIDEMFCKANKQQYRDSTLNFLLGLEITKTENKFTFSIMNPIISDLDDLITMAKNPDLTPVRYDKIDDIVKAYSIDQRQHLFKLLNSVAKYNKDLYWSLDLIIALNKY